ncbi:homocysteine S-methyltransferase [Streptomyces aidingensis]|uniref:Homocysteine S-methyltransferase n=1 Tax=Streptomyces aidingensis TaxID=910347 RepID=A0A1I1IPI3_9ACTN|nr:homocysteine S-methyltransferase [Streptomyces aidingensis]SFC35673.1 homocysteine S-methyltransferase [Streptomyces aidingensis]
MAEGFGEALRERVLVLDGGLSNQLRAQGCDLSGELWSARLLADDPGQIRAAHAAYLRAGAQVLISASYQASRRGFAGRGLGAAEADRLAGRSVALAREAAERAGRPGRRVWVAGSVGPYGAVLADGSEYRGRYGLGMGELIAFHRPRIEALAAAGPDVLALETVPDTVEAEALLRAAEGCGVPVWLCYTVAGGRTRAGQPLAEAFAVAAGNDQVVAVGVNCCDPREVTGAVRRAVAATGKPAVAYPNSGEDWDRVALRWRGPSRFAAAAGARAGEWAAAGARLIGGCCRVGPEDIAALAAGPGPAPGGKRFPNC